MALLQKVLLLLAMAIFVGWTTSSVSADETCAKKLDRIANEMDALADRYDKMADQHKSMAEICEFMRNTDIPFRRKVLAEVEGLRNRCATAPAAIAMAKDQLNDAIKREAERCGGSSKP